MSKFLFVCTGNICRSPMAEYLARDLASPEHQFSGAGTWTTDGRPPSESAVVVMEESGIDISAHRSADLWTLGPLEGITIFAMARDHHEEIAQRLPGADVLLLDPQGRSIIDPYGGSLASYRLVRDAIRAAIEERAPTWA